MEHPSYDSRISITDEDGDAAVFWVRRDFDLMRRIEQAFGALSELDLKLRRHALLAEQLVELYDIVLKAHESRPPADEIQSHVFQAGVPRCCDDLAVVVIYLFAGHRQAVAWIQAEHRRAAEGAGAGGDPLADALSTGISSLKRQGSSAGAPDSSGAPRTMN